METGGMPAIRAGPGTEPGDPEKPGSQTQSSGCCPEVTCAQVYTEGPGTWVQRQGLRRTLSFAQSTCHLTPPPQARGEAVAWALNPNLKINEEFLSWRSG